jgi:hypothetical protein
MTSSKLYKEIEAEKIKTDENDKVIHPNYSFIIFSKIK